MVEQLDFSVVSGREISLGETIPNFEYDPNKDVRSPEGGAQGHRLASEIQKAKEIEYLVEQHESENPSTYPSPKYFKSLETAKEKIGEIERSLEDWERYQSIAKRRDKGLKGIGVIFRDLTQAGYEIRPHGTMNKDESLAYLREIRSNIGEKVFGLHYRSNFWNRNFR